MTIAQIALTKWLLSADLNDESISVPDEGLREAADRYEPDLLSKGIAFVVCPKCDLRYRNSEVTILSFDKHRRNGVLYWTTEWRCPSGHVLLHEML